MQYDVMADRDRIPDYQGVSVMSNVQHAEILYVGPISDPDVIHIAPNDRVKPHTAVLAHDDIANDDGGGFNKARLRDCRLDALKRANHEEHSRGIDPDPARV